MLQKNIDKLEREKNYLIGLYTRKTPKKKAKEFKWEQSSLNKYQVLQPCTTNAQLVAKANRSIVINLYYLTLDTCTN